MLSQTVKTITNITQPDWNQTDDTASDYIKNRTHGKALTIIIQKTSVSTQLDEQYGLNFAAISSNIESINYEEPLYLVFNGETYSYTLDNRSTPLVGNMSFVDPTSEDSGEPFIIALDSDGMIATNEAMTASVYAYQISTLQLDSKFLQNNIPRYGSIGNTITIDWDGNTDGLDTCIYNAFNYYKVSDEVVNGNHISSLIAGRSDMSPMVSDFSIYNGHLISFYLLIVTSTTSSLPGGYYAPSTGVYLLAHQYTNGYAYTNHVEIDTHRENSILYLQSPSGVTFAITVDDNGTLHATEA